MDAWANKHTKRYTTSYVIREIQLKQQWGNTTNLLECPNFGTLKTPNAGEAMEQRELLFIAGGNVKWYSHFER